MKCRFHPEEEAMAVCQKFGYGYCRKCCDTAGHGPRCECTSPNVHCEFRQACVIHYLSKKEEAPG